MADDPILSVEGLGVRYGGAVALHDVSFAVPRGSLTGVIGPNGAGKSTLVKALCGRVPSEGAVSIAGTRLRPRRERQHMIGLVPQSIGLYPHMSGLENLQVFARLSGVPKPHREERIESALDTVRMADRAHICVGDMSGGMQRRINVAAAILHQPPIIIFDEPTAGVDLPARDVIHRLARRLAGAGHAVLLVTHELDQAEIICDRLIVLRGGRQLAFSDPASLLRAHYGERREVVVRFRGPPDAHTRAALAPFDFREREHPSIWSAMTEATEVSFVSAFMSALPRPDDVVREVTVRRPGLTTFIHDLEAA